MTTRWEPRDCAFLVTRVGAFSHLRMGELSPSPPRETRNPPPTPACNPRNPLFAVWGCQQEVALSLLPESLSPGSRWERQQEGRRGRDAEVGAGCRAKAPKMPFSRRRGRGVTLLHM